jgi:pyrroline-5-carboxylate reductase
MKVAIIGCGVMGAAFAKHFAKEHTVFLCDQEKRRRERLAEEIGGKPIEKMSEAIKEAEVVLLAVKPKDMAEVAKATHTEFSKEKLLMSILAGTSLSLLRKSFFATILRLMPNLALTCGEGVIGLVDDGHLSEEEKKNAEELLKGLGLLAWLPESKIEALTALAGSGPAFIFVIIEALIEGGISMGFNAEEAREFALKTIEGATSLLRATGKHPAELKWNVASPAGTTIAGLNEMEASGVRSGIIQTLHATYLRAKEIL